MTPGVLSQTSVAGNKSAALYRAIDHLSRRAAPQPATEHRYNDEQLARFTMRTIDVQGLAGAVIRLGPA